MNYNKVFLIGRLVRDPENVMLPSGSQVTNLVVAYNRSYKDQSGQWREESHFFDVRLFGRLAERLAPQLTKGDLVFVEGRLSQDKWKDKETGEPRSRIRIIALEVKVLSRASRLETVEKPPEEETFPSFEEEELLPPAAEQKSSDALGEIDDLLGEETGNPPPKGEKRDELDDLDDLLL